MGTMIGALVSIALCFLLLYVVSLLWVVPLVKKQRLKRNGLTGPPPLFPLGNLKDMALARKEDGREKDSLGVNVNIIAHGIHSFSCPYFARWRKAYGKVYVYWIGTEPFLYVGDPEFLRQVTTGALGNAWGKPNVFRQDRWPMFGNGLVMAEGDAWYHHRRIIAPAFSTANLNGMMGLMVESTSKMVKEWEEQILVAGGGESEIDVEKHIIKNAAEIIAQASFGASEEKGKKVFERLKAMQVLLFESNRMVGVPFTKLLLPSENLQAWRLGREIDRLLLSVIETRNTKQNDLLGLLLAGNEGNERKLSAQELVDECKTFFFGGFETTGIALSWTLLLLAHHTGWQEALREEVIQVTGGQPLDPCMLHKLVKMGWVMNEVLRLYPPAPNAQRQAKEDVRIGDITIPKGTNMWVDLIGIHHDPELWGSDADEFRPERFKESSHGGCKHRMSFMPFGFGGRVCIGRNLTSMEYKVVLSLILSKFSLHVSPSYVHCPRIKLSFRPSFGLPLVLKPLLN